LRLARFHTAGATTRLGRLVGGRVTDLSGIPGIGTSVRAILPRLAQLRPAIEAADGSSHALTDVVLEAPIDDPQKYLAIGMNYRAHARRRERPVFRYR